jgi:hypothetical protein
MSSVRVLLVKLKDIQSMPYPTGRLTFNVRSVGHVHTARNLCLFRAQIFVSLRATMQASKNASFGLA